ncbi:rnp24 [Symbiodinium sp. CCMP2592]|nr:rnp24 [Symbiodinium sp. CCMP2592]
MDDVDIYGDLLPPKAPPAKAVSSASDPRLADAGEKPERGPGGPGGPVGAGGAGASASSAERPFRPRARNLVWKAPELETPAVTRKVVAQAPKDTDEPEVVVLDDADPPQTQPQTQPAKPQPAAAESPPASAPPAQSPPQAVAVVAEAVTESKPKDFATLQKELQAEEASACPAAPGSPVSAGAADLDSDMEDGGVISDGTEGSEDGEIHLGEVRASETGTAAPHFRRAQEKGDSAPSSGGMGPKGPRIKKKEILLFIGPPPPLPPLGQPGESTSLLIGGLPWWLTDTELRRYGEQYGQVRRLRILDFAGSGKSAGVALLEFAQVDAARQALHPDGLCRPQLWRTLGAAPRAAAVGGELRGRLREGQGGHCAVAGRRPMQRGPTGHAAKTVRHVGSRTTPIAPAKLPAAPATKGASEAYNMRYIHDLGAVYASEGQWEKARCMSRCWRRDWGFRKLLAYDDGDKRGDGDDVAVDAHGDQDVATMVTSTVMLYQSEPCTTRQCCYVDFRIRGVEDILGLPGVEALEPESAAWIARLLKLIPKSGSFRKQGTLI